MMAKGKKPERPVKAPKNATPEQNVAAATDAMDAKSAKSSPKEPKKAQKEGNSGNGDSKFIPAPSARKRLDQIKRTAKLRKPFLEDAERYFRFYQGDYTKKGRGKKGPSDKMSVNILYSHIEIITPAIFSGFPTLKVRPKPKAFQSVADCEMKARNMELCLNYWAKELGADEILREVFLDTFFGPAFTEVGWETQIDDRKENMESEEGSEIDGPEVITLKDRPFIVRREFRDIYIDPDARPGQQPRWFGVREVIHWNDFKGSSQYTDHAKDHVVPQLYPKSEDDKDTESRVDDQSQKEWVEIFTIWDRDLRKKFVVSEGYQGYLNSEGEEGEDWPYDMEYKDDPFPICMHHAKRDRSTPYSWSEFKAYEPQVLELNRIRQALQVHVKAALPKYMYTENLGDKQTVNKLFNSRSDEGTKVENPDAIKQLEVADMPADNYKMAIMAKEDLIEVSGLSEYQGAPNSETATEASIVEGRSKMRKTMRSRLWENFVVENFAKLAQLLQQNMDEAIAVQIAGPNGVDWLNVTKEDIQGEFLYDVEAGSMEYKNHSLRMQQFLKFAELMGNDPNVNKRYMLTKGAEMFDFSAEDALIPIKDIPPPPPPEPKISFEKIDPLAIDDPALLNAVLLAALRQNGVDVGPLVDQISGASRVSSDNPMQKVVMAMKGVGGSAPPNLRALPGGEPPGPGGPSPKKVAESGGASPNGNPNLPPVQGNLKPGGNPNG